MDQLVDDEKYKSIYMSIIMNLHVYKLYLDSYRESKENAGGFVTHELLHIATLTSRDTVWNCQSIQGILHPKIKIVINNLPRAVPNP